jgi:hypothetical protein
MYYKNPNPNVVRSSMHVCMQLFLLAVAFYMHAFLPKIAFPSALAYFQQHLENIPQLSVSVSLEILFVNTSIPSLGFPIFGLLLESGNIPSFGFFSGEEMSLE